MPRPHLLVALLITGALAAVTAPLAWVSREEPVAAAPPLGRVRVRVVDGADKRPLPCRLTVVDAAGKLVPLQVDPASGQAVRTGVIYTVSGTAAFSVPEGEYTLYANRGMEYGLVQRRVKVGGAEQRLELSLRREVDTGGFVSCDPHIHTLTHSGHGDATVEERMATIAGEGIELAVATDHNHHVDFGPAARATGAAPFFTPVIGNEVTTSIGHFNAFPIKPGSAVPDPKAPDWKTLLSRMRATPGVKVVMLNHPSNNHSNYIPTDPKRFHPASGEVLPGGVEQEWSMDGMEVVTSAALQSDILKPYQDWFALLNRGLRISGMGSSDSHEVNQYILGQGRTYIAMAGRAAGAARPDQIDTEAACESILAGRVLVSMGLFTQMWVDGTEPGGFVKGGGKELDVRIKIQGPRWIQADRLELFANGQRVRSLPIPPQTDAVVKADLRFRLPRPAQDVWLVAVATGPGVDAPYWPIPRPYQPRRADWEPRVVGSTNPIRVDGNGDGHYQSPLELAMAAWERAGGDPVKLVSELAPHDEATAVQAASLCRIRRADTASAAFRRALDRSAPAVRHGFVAYQNLLPPS